MKALLVLFSVFAWCVSHAAPFSIPNTGISFDAPVGFSPLSHEEIARKYPRGVPPGFVVGNERRTTTIAFDMRPDVIPTERLPEVKASFEAAFEGMIPGLVWKERKLIDLQGRRCIYFEMSSRAVDTDIHNIMLVTPVEQGTVIFNFNSTKAEFAGMESTLRASLQSIRFRGKQ